MRKRNFISQLIILIAVILIAYFLVPNNSSHYMTTVINGALVYFIACLGVSIILGAAGQVSFASIAFMGFGGYASALLSMRAGFPMILAMITALIMTALVGLLLGLILLRLNGTFFTFATVALTTIASTVYNNWRELTGGADGIANVPAFSIGSLKATTSTHNYYVIVTIAILCALFVIRFRKTNLYRAMCSVRDNEIAAQVMGINVYKTKVIAFVMEAAFSALAGILLVHNNHFVGASAFVLDQASTFLIMVMLGGVGSTPGVFIGALLITMMPEWLKPLKNYIRLIYGVGVMLLMIFMPTGIFGLISKYGKKLLFKLNFMRKTTIGLENHEQEDGENNG